MSHTQIISGKTLAGTVVETVKQATARLIEQTGVVPGIAVVIIGEDPASQVYVRSKGGVRVPVAHPPAGCRHQRGRSSDAG